MSEENGSAAVEPADAFGVLADDTRVAILQALGAEDGPLSFSDLYERVDVADSGQFNYHLDKLTGHFARKVEDGYQLTTAGRQIHSAVRSGAYTDSADFDPVALPSDCPDCGGVLELGYSDEIMTVTCADCEETFAAFPVPPAAVQGRPREELPAVFDRHIRTTLQQTRAGICPLCSGWTTHEFGSGDWSDSDDDDGPVPTFECERCGTSLHSSPGAIVLDHPAVVAFYREHGVDVRDRPLWQLPWTVDGEDVVVAESPLVVRVTVSHGGETLDLDVDSDLTVHESDPTETR
jgi:hypothetical protein